MTRVTRAPEVISEFSFLGFTLSPCIACAARRAHGRLGWRGRIATRHTPPLETPDGLDTPVRHSERNAMHDQLQHQQELHRRDQPSLTRSAIQATLHCLTGCAIGEVLRMVLATALGWGQLRPRCRLCSRSSSATR